MTGIKPANVGRRRSIHGNGETANQDVEPGAMAQTGENYDVEARRSTSPRHPGLWEPWSAGLQQLPAHAATLDEASLSRIVKAAPLHDIGKIGIPDHILLKPGKLTPEQWRIMQSHCLIGANAIDRAITSTLEHASQAPHRDKPESPQVFSRGG